MNKTLNDGKVLTSGDTLMLMKGIATTKPRRWVRCVISSSSRLFGSGHDGRKTVDGKGRGKERWMRGG